MRLSPVLACSITALLAMPTLGADAFLPTLSSLGAQKLGTPCRAINARLGTLYRDPNSGRTFLALNSCTPGQGSTGSALLIDYTAGETTVLPFPVGSGGWDLLQTAPDRMLFESLSPLHLIPVNLRTRQVEADAIKPVPGSDYSWKFAPSSDGWIYTGSYPKANLYRYQPRSLAVEDLGGLGPTGNLYTRYVAATSEGWILSSVGMSINHVVAYNPQTKEQYVVANAVDANGKGVAPALVAVGGVVYAPILGELHQFDVANRKFVPAQLPAPPAGKKWTMILTTSTPGRKVLQTDANTLYLVEPGKAPQLIWDTPLRGGTVIGIDENNRVLGVRGQDYFVAERRAKAIAPRQITQNPPAVAIHFLRADPKGGVTGGPTFGQTLFRFDPARQLLHNTPQVVDGGGEVYDGQWVGGKFYFVAYAGGDLGVWDPAQPWDQWNNQNPRQLYSYKTPKDGGLIRPIGGLVVGPQGRLYSGWSGSYAQKAGGLGEYDIATGKARSWKNDIFAPEMSVGSIAADDTYVYGVTSNHFSGLKPTTKDVVFWAFDPLTEKVVFQTTLTGVHDDPTVLRVPGTGHIWLAASQGLRRFDSQTLNWAQSLSWPASVASPATVSAADASGAQAWFATGSSIVRLNDGPTPAAQLLVNADKPVLSLAASTDKKLYFTQGIEVWNLPLTE